MAILAPADWQYSPRDPAMDKGPSQSSSSSSNSQQQGQRSHQLPPAQPQHHPQQYPFQQQPQGSWTPSLAAPPFYPAAFYQNAQMTPQGTPQAYPSPGNPYFDPANAQLAAQWAYQQMMFSAQAAQQDFFAPPPGMHGQFNPFPSGTPPPRQEGVPPQPQQQQYAGFHPYRRPARQQSSHSESSASQQQDWRPQPPYSRPDASASSSSVNSQGRTRTNSNTSQQGQARGSHSPSPVSSTRGSPTSSPASANSAPAPPRLPHHRAGSSSSTHSTHSDRSSSSPASPPSSSSSSAKLARPSPLSQGAITAPQSRTSTSTLPSSTRAERRISRDDSSLALSSLSLLATRAEAAAASSSSNAPNASVPVKGSGLKGRLRRALSFNSSVALKEEVGAGEEDEDETGDDGGDDSDTSIKASVVNPKGPASAAAAGKAKTPALIKNATKKPGAAEPFPPASASSSSAAVSSSASSSSMASPASSANPQQIPLPKKKSRAASLFNSRLNASTDNISLSSTVSSASVMIRKLGSMGRLARRNSLAGITGLFKDRKKRGEGEDVEGEESGEGSGKKDKGKDGKKKDKDKGKKNAKGEASEASVSHATAELEAGDWSVPDQSMSGLSPAAKLARQHTLKTNAEAAAKAKEAAARAAAPASTTTVNGGMVNGGVNAGGVPTWERNTATRSPGKQRAGVGMAVTEDGSHVLVEESESEDEGQPTPHQLQQQQLHQQQLQQQQWDDEDDEEWGLLGGEEDDTIRQGIPEEEEYADDGDHEPWAVDIRRSVERTRQPAKGILKNADTYNQASYLPENMQPNNPMLLRARSNSYNSPATGPGELGPLARMPSPDPDHIDGLHRHGSHSSGHGGSGSEGTAAPKRSSIPSLPPLGFELGDSVFESPQVTPTASTYASAAAAQPAPTPAPAPGTLYAHPALNSSAPALVTLGMASVASPVPRAATAPVAKKHLAFASNLSVYDTFSASMYDRRSEPATWSRLTPALAQRIKEELNSYKMEEMEVHAASRIHTQFFV